MKKLIVALFFVVFGCSEDNSSIEAPLTGKWVEVTILSDTLTFLDQGFMMLDRGREIRNDISLPKVGSGSYDYRLLSDQISLRWHLSSNAAFNEYQFSKSGDMISVENFYDPDSVGTIQTFRKIE